METLVNLLGEHPCIVNILLGALTVHYREVSLYAKFITGASQKKRPDVPLMLALSI